VIGATRVAVALFAVERTTPNDGLRKHEAEAPPEMGSALVRDSGEKPT
jgi:hypothetical protein